MTPPHALFVALQQVLENLSFITKKLFTWLANNRRKANDDKCHLLLSFPGDSAFIQIENSTIKCSKVKKLLEVHIVYKLKSHSHVETIFKKAHRKLSVVSRITNYMKFPKKRILMNAILKAQSNYYPIIWMFRSCCLNNEINIDFMKVVSE